MRASDKALAAAALTAGLLGAAASPAAAQLATGGGDAGFGLTQVGSFNRPVHADNAPGTGSVLYVVESEGVIRVLDGTGVRALPFLDIQDLVRCCGEEGLLSVAFHPRYRRNRLFYAYLTNALGDNEVIEFKRKKRSRFVAARGSARRVLTIPHPTAENHNGGQLQFGPDGLLYVSTGDGGIGADNAQSIDSLSGKILRIDPLRQPRRKAGKGKRGGKSAAAAKRPRPYGIPAGNPFVGEPGRNEIYSLGLRNPFRFAFDAGDGAIALGDVGQGCREEIDYAPAGGARGANFGWPGLEGSRVFNPSLVPAAPVAPTLEYDNSGAGPGCPPLGGFDGVAVIPGYVVRDQRLPRQFGRLIYSDVASTDIRSLVPAPGGAIDDQSTGVINPAGSPFSFAEGHGNQLYLISGGGPVYRLDPA